MDESTGEYRALNQKYWDARTAVHLSSEFYDVPSFLAGRCSLPTIDQELLGDVSGKRLLHLQCHFGMDTISLARMDADVTGIDFSAASIETARHLAEQAGVQAKFIQSDVYQTASVVNGAFDVVYTSWGALVWLADLLPWVAMVDRVTTAGSRVVIIEFHPVVYMLNDAGLDLEYAYFNDGIGYRELSDGTYTDGDEHTHAMETVTYSHSFAEKVQPMLDAGFQLRTLDEYDFSPYGCFQNMVEDQPGQWINRKFGRNIPYVLALEFVKS